ncbi:hypothetical protein B7463_g11110, partial [Scytalidium lignicola]
MSSGPPPGIDLNADIRGQVIAPVIALMIIASFSVALRVVSKLTSKVSLQLDDYFIFAALIAAWGTGALSIYACYHGIGRHIWNPEVEIGLIVKVLWIYEFFYGSVIPLTKLSLVYFYYRIFPVVFFRKMLYGVLFLVIGWWIAIIIVAIVQCKPYNFFWRQYSDPTSHGKCINISAFFIGNGIASVVTDFLILATPIPMVWRLQMPIQKRMSVLGIFALGGFVCIAGIVRVYVLAKMFQSQDLTWNMSQAFVWSSVEPNIGIVCACLPTLYPLVRRYLPKWFPGSSVQASSHQIYGTGPSRLRSQNGEFYALNDHSNKSHNNKSDDEMGLTNEFRAAGRQVQGDGADDGHSTENNGMGITVKRDVTVTETSVF